MLPRPVGGVGLHREEVRRQMVALRLPEDRRARVPGEHGEDGEVEADLRHADDADRHDRCRTQEEGRPSRDDVHRQERRVGVDPLGPLQLPRRLGRRREVVVFVFQSSSSSRVVGPRPRRGLFVDRVVVFLLIFLKQSPFPPGDGQGGPGVEGEDRRVGDDGGEPGADEAAGGEEAEGGDEAHADEGAGDEEHKGVRAGRQGNGGAGVDGDDGDEVRRGSFVVGGVDF
mmetsp:Transcript_24266/g.78423  ORF Transcript_24266/g.78423 Transcript_24266/m.78423 type:complete len:228 (+) Transcript_24266:1517-2200(+)